MVDLSIKIPQLTGIPSLRKSLGQYQGAFERQITVLESDCRLADPFGNGTSIHCSPVMFDILESSKTKLEINFTKWNLRLDELLEQDSENIDHVDEYKRIWKEISKKYAEAKSLFIKTISNIGKPLATTLQPQVTYQGPSGAIKPINELKPFQLEKLSSPGRFCDWKRRFKSFFLASNLQHAPIETQIAYFRSCISPQLANLLDSKISENLSIYPDPNTPDDTSSCMTLLQEELEKSHPLVLCRLSLFGLKQGQNQTFSDFVALVKKKSESADISSFTADNILSYIVLSSCNDQDILEEVLKLSRNPTFEQIVQIGTNLEVSRSILHSLPGANIHNFDRSFKMTAKRGKNKGKYSKNNYLERRKTHQNYKQSQKSLQENLDLSDNYESDLEESFGSKSSFYNKIKSLKMANICHKCGEEKHIDPEECKAIGKVCFRCNGEEHLSKICLSKAPKNHRLSRYDEYTSEKEQEGNTASESSESSENEASDASDNDQDQY